MVKLINKAFDCFASLEFEDQRQKSATMKQTRDPIFAQTFTFYVRQEKVMILRSYN